MPDEKIVAALCEKFRKETDGDPQALTVLSLVTWEEIFAAVVNDLRMLGALTPDIALRGADDWIALYKDGEKVAENHSLPLSFALEALGIPFENVYYDTDEMDEYGGALKDGSDAFPERLP